MRRPPRLALHASRRAPVGRQIWPRPSRDARIRSTSAPVVSDDAVAGVASTDPRERRRARPGAARGSRGACPVGLPRLFAAGGARVVVRRAYKVDAPLVADAGKIEEAPERVWRVGFARAGGPPGLKRCSARRLARQAPPRLSQPEKNRRGFSPTSAARPSAARPTTARNGARPSSHEHSERPAALGSSKPAWPQKAGGPRPCVELTRVPAALVHRRDGDRETRLSRTRCTGLRMAPPSRRPPIRNSPGCDLPRSPRGYNAPHEAA